MENQKFLLEVSGVTITADVEFEEKLSADGTHVSGEYWISFFPTIADGKNELTMGRFYFWFTEYHSVEKSIIDSVMPELYRVLDFVDKYPTFDNYQNKMEGFGEYDEYIRAFNNSLTLRKIITHNWVDSVILAQRLAE